jgi:coenzyme F420 hydrogenase subunit beta
MSPASPLEPVSLLARTEHEVLPAMGSKYCSVATNSRLADVMAGNDRVAVVGLPCHIHGVRKAQRSIPQLKEKVVLCISLFCGMVQTLQGTLVLLKSRGIHPEEVIEIRYRGSGWPGSLQVSLRDGQTYSEPYKSYYGRYFTSFFPHRCTLCTDGVGELADISCGDAWLPEYESDDHGTSLLIARSRKGTDLLSLAVPADITLSPTTAAKVRESQEQMLTFKKRGAAARARLCLLARRRVPCYVEELPAARIIDYVDAIKFYLKHFVYRLLAGSGR